VQAPSSQRLPGNQLQQMEHQQQQQQQLLQLLLLLPLHRHGRS
jgi:hypothetical protein